MFLACVVAALSFVYGVLSYCEDFTASGQDRVVKPGLPNGVQVFFFFSSFAASALLCLGGCRLVVTLSHCGLCVL